MKTLELRPEGPEYHLPTSNGTPVTAHEAEWRALVEVVVNSPPLTPNGKPAGYTPKAMRKRMRLVQAVEELAADATALVLEDADATELIAALQSVRFQRASKWLEDFCDAVEAMAN